MKKGFILLLALLVLGGAKIITTLAPTAEIVIEALSPQEVHDLGMTTGPSSGLSVVGKGEIVYLVGQEATGEAVTSYSWSLDGPDGSTVQLGSDTRMVAFRPDVVGEYTIELTLNTASGSASATRVITAAEYVGAGVHGVTADAAKGQCAACHPTQTAKWLATNHATFFSRAIDGQASSHYGEHCIGCHTNGFDESAENNGFDDLAEEHNWEFPATLQTGNWEIMLEQYPEVANMASIQCENCHGPGSEHAGRKEGIAVSLEEGVCGKCHEEEPYHTISSQWENSGHAIGIASAAGRTGCADCHSGYGYIAKVDPASNLDQKTGFEQVSCAVCHDPHPSSDVAQAGVHQLRSVQNITLMNGETVTGGGFGRHCMSCHKSRRNAEEYVQQYASHFGPHYSNQTDMLLGTNVATFGRTLPNSTHFDAVENSCVGCHMSPTPGRGEPGHLELGGHSWAMSTDEVDHVAACQRCHGDIESFEDIKPRKDHDGDGQIESAVAEVEGLLHDVGMLLPPLGQPEVTVTPDYSPLQLKAAYNYIFVEEDGSHGLHNFQFTVSLLKLTKEVLTYGVLTEGDIAAITDVPGDQGKQVLVDWTRFGGDGPSDNPIEVYHVWRRIDAQAAGKNMKIINSFEEITATTDVTNAAVWFDDGLWTQVGSQPAAQRAHYGAIVPTLYDSTDAGVQWSFFTVSGHTRVNTIYTVAAPDSAYSIDNLSPTAPSKFSASVNGEGVVLNWATLPDPDIRHIAVYRGTSPGFDAAGIEPVATISGSTEYMDKGVEKGKTYYYRLAAYDLSGNRGQFSNEVTAAVATGMESIAGIPTSFELEQNYPNPFNPTTGIRFGIPNATHVRIIVYNLQGRKVGVVVDQEMTPGRYEVTWDASTMASGLYIYRMETSEFTTTRTMMLLK